MLLDAIILVVTKKVFTRFKALDYKSFAWWLFVWIVILGLFLAPWFVHIQPAATEPYYLWLLLSLVFLAANYNLLYYFGLEYEKLCVVEPFLLFNPIITIVIASLFYADERSWHVYVAAAVAGLALAWAHVHRRHLKLDRHLWAILGFSLLYGLEAVIIKQLLAVYSPLTLYLIRAAMTAVFLWVVEKGKIMRITRRQIPHFLVIAASAIGASTSVYMSYKTVGIGLTMGILLLSPVLVYLASVVYLKEKLQWKNLVASGVIMGAIIWLVIVR